MPAPARQASVEQAAGRSVRYVVYDLFNAPLEKDAWRQRAEVGHIRARHFDDPVTIEFTDVPGPNLYPGIPARPNLYAPARVRIDAQGLGDLTIDTLGGISSAAPEGAQRGFLPRDLLGGLGSPPAGGTAVVHASMRFLDRDRANQLFIPEQFGFHGWETETNATITLDRNGARKVLGIGDAPFDDFHGWWRSHEAEVEQAWRYWLYDEAGDVHVGGVGRLDTRVSAGGLPLQIWMNDLELLDADDHIVTLSWDLVGEPIEQLWARWLRESVQSGFEPSSISDLTFDATIGSDGADVRADYVWDFALFKVRGTDRWIWESQLADVPGLVEQYEGESIYDSPGQAYVGAGGGRGGTDLGYVPGAFVLGPNDTFTLDLHDPNAAGKLGIDVVSVEPTPADFPTQVDVTRRRVRFEGPMDMAEWSSQEHIGAWERLGGLLPWGAPYITLEVAPRSAVAKRFEDQPRAARIAPTEGHRAVPPMPHPNLGPPKSPPPPGRVVEFDFYDWLDVPMVADRWRQYEANDYVRIESLRPPVRYRTTPYFSGGQVAHPFRNLTSGIRLRVAGRHMPEVSMATIGGGSRGAGFLPHDLMGGLGPESLPGAHATFDGYLQYGTREREAIYRQEQYWGYYGWENFLDARITLDGAGARTVLGITQADLDRFGAWWTEHEIAVETAWKRWLMAEFVRLTPMPFFNFPLEIWNLNLTHRTSADGTVVLQLTILNEALDLVFSRWFLETFMPQFESSLSDMHLRMRIGPHTSRLTLDTATDWTLSGEDLDDGTTRWTFEPFMGDNPVLANEYRAANSPAFPYLDKVFRPGTPDALRYSSTPTAFDLQPGERLTFHWLGSGLLLRHIEPRPSDFPGQIVRLPKAITFVGPLDLTSWSRVRYAEDWASLGGLLPRGAPIVQLEG